MIRLGVIGNRDYPDLSTVLKRMLSLAESLGIDIHLEASLKDLAGDDNHWAATVKSSAFKGKTRVAQHQMVYAALKGNMGGVLHALQLTTVAKD